MQHPLAQSYLGAELLDAKRGMVHKLPQYRCLIAQWKLRMEHVAYVDHVWSSSSQSSSPSSKLDAIFTPHQLHMQIHILQTVQHHKITAYPACERACFGLAGQRLLIGELAGTRRPTCPDTLSVTLQTLHIGAVMASMGMTCGSTRYQHGSSPQKHGVRVRIAGVDHLSSAV